MGNQKSDSIPIKEALEFLVNRAAKPYYQEKLRAEKQKKVHYGQISSGYSWRYIRKYESTVRDIVIPLFPDAIEKVSSSGKYGFSVRQLYYVIRPLYATEKAGQKSQLEYNYFAKLLEEYERSIGRRIALREINGEMIAPHEAEGCALGTAEVAQYVVPKHKFNKIIYIEKRGFIDPIVTSNFHNRFDVAIAAGVGFSTWAARDLLAKIQRITPIKIFCVHDADIAGCDINRTLSLPSPFNNYRLKVIDLGLTPKQAIERNMEVETYYYKQGLPCELAKTLSPQEIEWLKGGEEYPPFDNAQRVELNAFTPEEFLKWLEERLDELGIKEKVRPEDKVVDEKTQETVQTSLEETVDKALEDILLPVKEKLINNRKLLSCQDRQHPNNIPA